MLARMPSTWTVFKRGARRGLLSAMRQRGWGLSLVSLLAILFLAQMFIGMAVGVGAGLSLLREQTDIRLEVLDSATDIQIQDFIQNLRSLPYVQDVVYVTRAQAYEQEKSRDPQLVAFLEKFGIKNPFPETVGVRLKTLAAYPALTAFLKQSAFAQTIDPAFLSRTTDQQDQVERLVSIVSAAQAFLWLIVALTGVALLFSVVEQVRRRILLKREELFIEQLVGATSLSIVIPFCVEIALLLLLAFALAFLFATVCLFALPAIVPSLAPGGLFYAWAQRAEELLAADLPWLLTGEISALLCVAAVGTLFGLLPRLKMSTLSFT